MAQTAIQWYCLDGFFGMAGEPKDVEYIYANDGPAWSYLATNINISLLGIIADSLLVRMRFLYFFLFD